jgi:hypothetical protein
MSAKPLGIEVCQSPAWAAEKSKRDGVLILGHCGGRGLEAVAGMVTERGLAPYVLSSRPLKNAAERLRKLADVSDWTGCSADHDLTPDDLGQSLDRLAAAGARVRCCIGVWEGYRRLMAEVNERLGASDLKPAQVDRLLNKFGVREYLAERGLTRARAQIVTEDNLEALKRSERRLFVKPVRGIASYGAFELEATTTWDDLQRIAAAAEADTQYRSVIGTLTFLAEDYIEGYECSFETLVVEGVPYVVAVHEKAGTTALSTTVLENVDVAPPWNVDPPAVAAGVAWLERVFAALGIEAGCYHVEARFDGTNWDLIEINPRIAGSLISDSVAVLSGGPNLMDLWLDTLLRPHEMHAELSALAIDQSGGGREGKASFIRSYYGTAGRIAEIEQVATKWPPRVFRIYVGPQDDIPGHNREIAIAHGLWAYDADDRSAATREALLAESERALHVRYEAAIVASR